MAMGGMGVGGSFGASQDVGGSTPSKHAYDEMSITPLTIKQFQTATPMPGDGGFTVDGVPLKDVRLIGRVLEATPSDSNLSIAMEDGTGRLIVKHWYPNAGDGTPDAAAKAELDATIHAGMFVRVHGATKLIKDRPILANVQFRSLKDPNELTLHFIECVHVHLDRTKRIPFSEGGSNPDTMGHLAGAASATGASGAVMAATGTGFGMQGMGDAPQMGSMAAMGGGGGISVGAGGGASAGGSADLGTQVAERVKTYTGENGAPVPELVQFFAKLNVDEAKVRAVVEDLCMNGVVYSTIDDDHIKSTDE